MMRPNYRMKPLYQNLLKLMIVLSLFFAIAHSVNAERIKDLATIGGVRANQLVGYGLVVGLPGSGDQTTQTQFTVQSLKSTLARLGVIVPEEINPQLQNVAAVLVHAELPAFAKAGQTIDVTVSSIGNAASLRGGSLLMTPLKGADGEVYALAQGNLVVGGFGAEGADGSSVVVNIPSSGRIPNGAIVEKEVFSPFVNNDSGLTLNLNRSDFTTAMNMAAVINETFGTDTALAVDGTSVKVMGPQDYAQKVGFISVLENLLVEPGDATAKVIINSRTGTVVIGQQVRVDAAAVAHGSLTVTIAEDIYASQPGPFNRGGRTALVPDTSIYIDEGDNRMFLFEPGINLDELVRAVNQVGASPSDLVAILEALQQVGALRAQLIVI